MQRMHDSITPSQGDALTSATRLTQPAHIPTSTPSPTGLVAMHSPRSTPWPASDAPALSEDHPLRLQDSTHAPPTLLLSLTPVRQLWWRLLTDADVGRVMRVSRATTRHLLCGYAFCERFFVPRLDRELFAPPSFCGLQLVAWCWRGPRCIERCHLHEMLALYRRHGLRITRLSLCRAWNAALHDEATGESLLPPSLLVLMLGAMPRNDRSPHLLPPPGSRGASGEWEADDDAQMDESFDRDRALGWRYPITLSMTGAFNRPLPPRALPDGLRRLHLSDAFDQPLQAGSIPSSVTFLQCGAAFNQPLVLGVLPSALRHLVFGCDFNQSIQPGVLPASLRRLSFGSCFDQLLCPGSLPMGLKWLDMGHAFNQPILPGVLPQSLTHLCLGNDVFGSAFDQSLHMDSLPCQLHHLDLGGAFRQPILPGMLPSSLRHLILSSCFDHPLPRGALPHGLESMHFPFCYRQPLLPGVLPSTVVRVTLRGYAGELQRGSIPASVERLVLPAWRRGAVPHISPSCAVEFEA